MFHGASVDGRRAWTWIKENGGVGVVDHGFRVRPYGFRDDDWLNLGLDIAHRKRTWRSTVAAKVFPLPPEASSARANPVLYLPGSHQLIGAVFLETSHPEDRSDEADLVPSMDREGFVDNAAFRRLVDIVRGGLELLAFVDHQEQRRIEDEKREQETQELREDLQEAAEYIATVPGLSTEDKDRVVERFSTLAQELDEVEQYYEVAAGKLETMGLLGVLAGFVTHEAQGIINSLDRLLKRLRRSGSKTPEIKSLVSEIAEAKKSLVAHLDYSTAFIGAVHESEKADAAIVSRSSAELARDQVLRFADDRGISVTVEVEADLMTPRLPRALYNGVLLNLLTNALKAAASGTGTGEPPEIVIRGWNEPGWHVIEVADNGVGIPPSLRRRIWDPLFTTTSAQNLNPLGSGMGLGLTLVKKVMESVKGRVDLVEPPPGYVTCFRASFRR